MFSRRRWLAIAAVLVAAAEVAFDALTLIPLNVSILYGLPLVLAGLSGKRSLLWGLTASLLAAAFLVYAIQIPPGTFTIREPLFINRLLAGAALITTAALLHILIDAMESLDARALADREASARKTRILASVSHDIHTPLTAINLMADMIAAAPAGGKTREIARNLQASALALTDLVADVLNASRLDSGLVTLHESEFSLNDLVADECRQSTPVAEAKGLEIHVAPGAPEIWLRADRIKLARALRNLVSNAIKFTEKGFVELGCSLSPQGEALIQVKDTGPGIAKENLGKLFTEFARFGASPSDGRGGWGLGLPICRRLVGLMGGTVSAESEPNGGSIFTVRLPKSRVCAAAHAPAGTLPGQYQKK